MREKTIFSTTGKWLRKDSEYFVAVKFIHMAYLQHYEECLLCEIGNKIAHTLS